MPRQIFKYDKETGELVEVYNSEKPVIAPYVQDDTMPPLKHPQTGEIFDSKSAYLRECDRLGLRVVGNDLLSKRGHQVKDKITDAVIMDKIEQAEAIHSDYSKRERWKYDQHVRLERMEKLMKGNG